jgi:hypothetical protein
MDTETYLTAIQTKQVFLIIHNLSLLHPRPHQKQMGIKWVYERDQYMIEDKKKWLFAKLKYGL